MCKICSFNRFPMAVIAVESEVKYSLVLKGMQTRRKGQYNAELTLSPRLCVKPLITAITAIATFLVKAVNCPGTTRPFSSLRGPIT